MKTKILFILKRKEDYCENHYNLGLSTGLFNSASFMSDMLNKNSIESKIVVVIDNNSIDKEVSLYKPTHVIIEALWVIPTKFEILKKLHPNVQWIVRLHSELPFIANEGNAMGWIGEYLKMNDVSVGVNSLRMYDEIIEYFKSLELCDSDDHIIYLPNYYPQIYKHKKFNYHCDVINISCFGAIRPLKNQLLQAFAAIKFANHIDKKLKFHINSGRYESKGEPIFKNLNELFKTLPSDKYELILHEWSSREEFLELCSEMDISLQCSFSETFNIVGCDSIVVGTPLIGSDEIVWLNKMYTANPTSSNDIFSLLLSTYNHPKLNVFLNQSSLKKYTNKTEKIWVEYFS